jgi:hypothetical protein
VGLAFGHVIFEPRLVTRLVISEQLFIPDSAIGSLFHPPRVAIVSSPLCVLITREN